MTTYGEAVMTLVILTLERSDSGRIQSFLVQNAHVRREFKADGSLQIGAVKFQ